MSGASYFLGVIIGAILIVILIYIFQGLKSVRRQSALNRELAKFDRKIADRRRAHGPVADLINAKQAFIHENLKRGRK